MARTFNGTSDRVSHNTAPLGSGGIPLTISAWFYETTANGGVISGIFAFEQFPQYGHYLRVDASNNVLATAVQNDSATSATSSATFSLDVWNHGAAVFSSTTSRTVYLNGSNSATDTTSKTVADVTGAIGIGAFYRNFGTTSDQFFTGRIAEVAMWSVALTAAEVASLAKGLSPLYVRPESLIYYRPLVGPASSTLEYISARATSNNNGSASGHPRIYGL